MRTLIIPDEQNKITFSKYKEKAHILIEDSEVCAGAILSKQDVKNIRAWADEFLEGCCGEDEK